MSAIAELTLRKKTGGGRNSLSPSMRDNCRLCVKFGSQGDQIGNENLQFQPSKQTGSFDVILAKLYVWKCWIANRILRAKDQSDRVCSSSGKKIRTLHQLYSFVSSVLFSSENERSESEERFKRPVQALPSNPGGGRGGAGRGNLVPRAFPLKKGWDGKSPGDEVEGGGGTAIVIWAI